MSAQSGSCMDLWAIYPELLLAGQAILLVSLGGFVRGRWQRLPALLAGLGFLGAMILTARMLPWPATAVFCNTYAVDGLANGFKLMLEAGALITLLLADGYFRGHPQRVQAPLALTFATLGAVGLASSLDLGLIVLFLQMMSMASYLLVCLVRSDPYGNEAALKYFIYGATALAIMAYGLTFLYGLTGDLDLRAVGRGLRGADFLWIGLAVGMILIGYAFEATVAPFHFWAPDVYQGSTAPIAGFLSVVPKIAGFAGLMRFLMSALPGGMLGWPLIIALLATVTMTWGNLAALRQTHLKRLLAYSSIAQAGYVLVALAAAQRAEGALSAAGYYLAAYLFMNLAAFIVAAQLERALGSDGIGGLQGLARKAPGPAVVLALALLSLAGIPPLAGFAGKVLVLEAALDGGLIWLAVIAIINMVIGLYYYVAVIAQMLLREPVQGQAVSQGWQYALCAGLSVSGIVLLGVLPNLALQLTTLIGVIVP